MRSAFFHLIDGFVLSYQSPGQNHSISSGANSMPLLSARELSDAQWAILDPLIPEPPRRQDGRGRPWKARRSVLSSILWTFPFIDRRWHVW